MAGDLGSAQTRSLRVNFTGFTIELENVFIFQKLRTTWVARTSMQGAWVKKRALTPKFQSFMISESSGKKEYIIADRLSEFIIPDSVKLRAILTQWCCSFGVWSRYTQATPKCEIASCRSSAPTTTQMKRICPWPSDSPSIFSSVEQCVPTALMMHCSVVWVDIMVVHRCGIVLHATDLWDSDKYCTLRHNVLCSQSRHQDKWTLHCRHAFAEASLWGFDFCVVH